MALLMGCIADDFTGGTDLASMLVKSGMRTVQTIGLPEANLRFDDVDAVVIALKSRTAPVDQAVAESLAALRALRELGCQQFYFKYCSTFDSTPAGNIGPVAEALMDELGVNFTIACPAFPANGRTIYKGHLFVGNVLLSDSSMRHHPLTPMTDSNLVRVLQQQTRRRVGLVAAKVPDIRQRLEALAAEGVGLAIADAIDDADLMALGEACAGMKLVTAGSGLAMGLAENYRRSGLLSATTVANVLPPSHGCRAVISGSCSAATNAQVAIMKTRHPAFAVDPFALARGEDVVATAIAWARGCLSEQPILIYATAGPESVSVAQASLGAGRIGALIENALAAIARGLVELGVERLIVAGGETSGAVVKALGVTALRIGPEIDPGVPWTTSLGTPQPIALALKSGNFGTSDFFLKAWERLA
jgi:3-dehydrotetronate 4-kinase